MAQEMDISSGKDLNIQVGYGISEAWLLTIKGIPISVLKENSLLAVYRDDYILAVKEEHESKRVIKKVPKEFEITDKGEVDEYLGVKLEKQKYGTKKMYQPYLITQIFEMLSFNERKPRTPQL